MARQHTRSRSLKSIAGTALAGLGIFVLFGNVDWAANPLGNFLCSTAGEALGVLPCIVLAAWQAMQAYGLDHHRLLECLLQMLPSFWPLLLVVAGAI